jgi:hypothetical protein
MVEAKTSRAHAKLEGEFAHKQGKGARIILIGMDYIQIPKYHIDTDGYTHKYLFICLFIGYDAYTNFFDLSLGRFWFQASQSRKSS